MSNQPTSRNSAPRPYFRTHAVPDAVKATGRGASTWIIRGATVITAFALIFSVFAPAQGAGNSGAIWTTEGSCGDPQNSNAYAVGDEIFINGSGFDAGSYPWDITGQPNSGDPSTVVASGNVVVTASGAFCFSAYTVLPGDDGVYKYGVGNKNDNYHVDGVTAPTTGGLTVIKNTVNGNGTFSFTATGPSTVAPFQITTVAGTGTNPTITGLTPGTYSITEGVLAANWALSTNGCASVVVVAGQTASCTVTNTYTTPRTTGTLIVKKVIVGSNAVASDFSFQVNGDPAVAFEADAQNDLTVTAGAFSVTEVANTAYTTTYDNCTAVVVAVGGSQTCTITNTFITTETPRFILLVKKIVSGGAKVASDFMFTLTGNSPSSTSVTGSETGVSVTMGTGAYTVTEDSHDGYTVAYSADCNGSFAVGDQSKECTVTNTVISSGGGGGGGGGGSTPATGSISGVTYIDNNTNGTFDAGDITLPNVTVYLDGNSNGAFDAGETNITSNGSGAFLFSNLNPGTYTVREVTPSGYSVTQPTPSLQYVVVSNNNAVTDRNFGHTSGRVLGESTTTPQVAGASTTLPTTGMNLITIALIALVAGAAGFSARKFELNK